MAIFTSLEGKDIVFENDPYFFNSVDLFLHPWTKQFIPDKEDFTVAPVWIRLYSLLQEY
jgi:hypothetical protein